MTNCHQQGSEQIDRSRQKNYNWKHSIALCKICFTDNMNSLKIKLLRVHSLLYFPNKPIYQPINSDNQWARRQVDWETFVSKCPVEGQTTIGRVYLFPMQLFQQGECVKLFVSYPRQLSKKKLCPTRTFYHAVTNHLFAIYIFDKLWTNCN